MKLEATAAVVTGSAGGLGRGIAFALARAGADVVVADIDSQGAERTAAEIAAATGRKVLAFRCDVSDPASIESLADFAFERLPHLTMLFNNAGVVAAAPVLDTTPGDLQWQFGVNVFGVWNGSVIFARRFIDKGIKAWICNTASENGLAAASIGTAAYTAAKHAVIGMTDAFRIEFAGSLGFSVICPGIVNTGMWNAGRNRPEKFGGKFEGNPINQKAMTFGIDPEEAGRLVVKAVADEHFFVFTHRHVAGVAEQRWHEIEKAAKAQLPVDDGALSTLEIQRRLMEQLAGSA